MYTFSHILAFYYDLRNRAMYIYTNYMLKLKTYELNEILSLPHLIKCYIYL